MFLIKSLSCPIGIFYLSPILRAAVSVQTPSPLPATIILLSSSSSTTIVLSVLVLFGGVAGGVAAVVLAAYVWKWCRRTTTAQHKNNSKCRGARRHRWRSGSGDSRFRPTFAPSSAHSTIVLAPRQCQEPLIRHFQQRQLSHRSVDSNKTLTSMDGTKCLMEELAMDTKKLAKLFPMIKPKPDSKSYGQMVDQQQQTETVDSSNAGQKRHRLTARHSEKEGDETMLNVPTPLCSIERGTQTSPRPLPPVAAVSISAQATTKVTAAVPPPPPTPAARRTVAINTVRQQRGTVEEQNGQEDDDVINTKHGQNGNQNRHHRVHYVNDDDEADEEQQRQQRQRAKWRERVVEIVAQRQQHQSVPQQRHHFAKMGQQKWPMMPPKPTPNLTIMAQQQNERRKSHFGTKTRSFEERPSGPQPRIAWRHARSNQFVAQEWAEMGQKPYNNYPQNIGIRIAGIRRPLPFPAPPPRRPRHAHLQRFFRSADIASSTSDAEEEQQHQQQLPNVGCGGCSSSSSSSSSSSTTMPTMEEGRRMGSVAAAPFLRDARNSSRRLYRSVDDEGEDDYSSDYGDRNRHRYGRRGMALIRGDQQQQHDVHQYQHQRRFLPDLPTSSRTMRTQMEEQQFSAPSSVPRPLQYNNNNNNSTAWRYYRVPPTSRRAVAEPPLPPLARFNSLKRVAVAPLRRDFSVDRRTESLFRHFVRPDPFEIL
ncbi:hypothetical protein niasHS_006341 [Heterodera schachtii]|uniref:Uncharacterized protein n=1 Tax=Heterodera schachtii TaxID=97005 RepID=A0ABD2JWS3_HETSC